jgi:hypothetical protein
MPCLHSAVLSFSRAIPSRIDLGFPKRTSWHMRRLYQCNRVLPRNQHLGRYRRGTHGSIDHRDTCASILSETSYIFCNCLENPVFSRGRRRLASRLLRAFNPLGLPYQPPREHLGQIRRVRVHDHNGPCFKGFDECSEATSGKDREASNREVAILRVVALERNK